MVNNKCVLKVQNDDGEEDDDDDVGFLDLGCWLLPFRMYLLNPLSAHL